MMHDFDVIVIGGGVIGASIFYHLIKEKYHVALLERKSIASGCTGSSAGIVRCFHLDNTLSDRAIQGWCYYLNFKKNTGEDCKIHKTGFIYIPKRIHHEIALFESRRLSHKISIKWLPRPEIESHFSNIFNQIPEAAVYESEAGYMCAQSVTEAWINAAKFRGGMVYEHTSVQKIICFEDYIKVETNHGAAFSAKKIVIAAGAFTPALLDHLGIVHNLYVKNIHLDIRHPKQFSLSHPAFIDDHNELYGRPDLTSLNMYIGLPTNHRSSNEQHSQEIFKSGVSRFNWVRNSGVLGKFYNKDCYSSDGLGYVMALNANQTLFVASGFSGGGFKMAPWAGQEMVRLFNKSE